jgi:D-3-phosphoglycerate dehydrogenase
MTKPKVLISDALSPAAVQIFRDRGVDVDFQPNLGKDKDKLAEIIGNYDGLAIRSATKATAKIIDKATRLKVIGRAGIGVDNVEIPAATAKGIIVMNTPFGNSITTAEHAITLMLALAREIPQADASTQAGKWEKNRFMGVEITGKTLGVIGAGNIGSLVIDRALGLRMRVIAYDPFLSPERAADMGVHKVELAELFKRADFITLHTPLTDKTKNIVDAGSIASVVHEVLGDVARDGLADDEVARAKGQLRGNLVLGLEDSSSRMSRIGKGELAYGEYLTVEQTLERIESVTPDEVAALAGRLLSRPVATALVGPYAHTDDIPAEVVR